MKTRLFFLFSTLTIFLFHAYAQNATDKYDTITLPRMVIGDDTLEQIVYEPVIIYANRLEKANLPDWQMRYLRIVYPYALRTARVAKKVDEELAQMDKKRDKKKYLNDCEKVLREQFENTLKNLTRKQGQMLILLINRETGRTVYDLLSDYRSGFKAFWWNVIGKMYDLDMKAVYEPNGKDKEMEKYVLFLEDVYKVDGTKYIIDNEDVNIPNSNK